MNDNGDRGFIQGAGGGAPAGGGPDIEEDSLQSIAYADALFLIGEGEISGFPTENWARHIYFDDTPVERNNGTRNFKGVTFKFRAGTLGQSFIPGTAAIQSEDNVNVKVVKGTPVVRTITNPDADWAKVRIMIPALQQQENNGDVKGAEVEFAIDVAAAGQPFQQRIRKTLRGKASNPVQFDYRVRLRGNAPWQVRVRRITNDSTSQQLQNDLIFQALTTIVDARLRYPGSALFQIRFDSRFVRPGSRISVEMLGLKILVPHNYNPIARTYTGVFTGELKREYSNNPAWIYYNLLVNRRWGCGKFIDAAQVDLWSLYAIGQYCDQLVPNGLGGMEPRYTCNLYMENREDAYTVLNSIASIFRGMAYWARGSIVLTYDAPRNPSRLYTEANVVQEVDEEGRITKPPFVYSGSSVKTRASIILVEWSDPRDGYKAKVESYIDKEALQLYGYREKRVVAVGCTSQGQARRTGKWISYSEQSEDDTCTFSVGTEGLLPGLGEVVKVADPTRSLSRWGGRILEVEQFGSMWELRLDAAVETGFTGYTISLLRSTGAHTETTPLGDTYAAGTAIGRQYELPATVVSSTLVQISNPPEPPIAGTIWILSSNQVKPQLFRVVGISETQTEPRQYEIVSIAHNPDKYDFIEFDEPIEEPPITTIADPNRPPDAPSELVVTEFVGTVSGELVSQLTATWQPVATLFLAYYLVEWRSNLDPAWTTAGTTADTTLVIPSPTAALYDFRVVAVTGQGVRGFESNIFQIEVFGTLIQTQNEEPILTQNGEPILTQSAS